MAPWGTRPREGSWPVCIKVSLGSAIARKGRSTSGGWRRAETGGWGATRVYIRAASCKRWRWGELAAGENNRNVDDSSIDLGFVHVGDRCLGIGFRSVQDVCCPTIGVEVPVDWHVQISNLSIHAKDLAEMVLVDVLRELLNHNLCASDRTWASATTWAAGTTLGPVPAISSRTAADRTGRDGTASRRRS